MSVLEHFVYPGIICVAGIYYTGHRSEVLQGRQSERARIGQTRTPDPTRPPGSPRMVVQYSVQKWRDGWCEEIETVRAIGPRCLHHTKHYTP